MNQESKDFFMKSILQFCYDNGVEGRMRSSLIETVLAAIEEDLGRLA